MITTDDELALTEHSVHLASIKADFLAAQEAGGEISDELVSRLFRTVHSVGQRSLCKLVKTRRLAQQMEDVLALIRSSEMTHTPRQFRVLLRATVILHELLQNPGASNQADISEIVASLAGLCADHYRSAERSRTSATAPAKRDGKILRMLLVEDDFTSRLLLQTFLSRYGECHVAVNGKEAVEAFRSALDTGDGYELICMDLLMPEMDGREAIRRIRAMEEAHGMFSPSGVKIIMTTAVGDIKEVSRCFEALCDLYLVKPIDLAQLLRHMKAYQLVP